MPKIEHFSAVSLKNVGFSALKITKMIFFKKMLIRVPQNFIAVIMKQKLVHYEYPDSLTFF